MLIKMYANAHVVKQEEVYGDLTDISPFSKQISPNLFIFVFISTLSI